MKNTQKMNFTDKIEVISNILSIILSIMAIYGSLLAISSGFLTKISKVVDSVHSDIINDENKFKGLEKDLFDYIHYGKY